MKSKVLFAQWRFGDSVETSDSRYSRKKRKRIIRYVILAMLLLLVWLTQSIPPWGEWYARSVYPSISYLLSSYSNLFSFSFGDLFVFCSLLFVMGYPIYGRIKKHSWGTILRREVEFLVSIYVWFYLAWGLNYSQKDFHHRTGISYVTYTPTHFQHFVEAYVVKLNRSYVPLTTINPQLIESECVRLYTQISDSLGVHCPPRETVKVKTMLFTPFVSKVGVTGSMAPFFSEFTVNGYLRPSEYPFTYAHELAHLLGITSEAEANFYAYQVCTRSSVGGIRFSGYFSVMGHILRNAKRFLSEDAYRQIIQRIRPEIIKLHEANHAFWMAKYSPVVGDVQDWIYDIYLKRNHIESGRQNYSEVVGLLISYDAWKTKKQNQLIKK